MSIFTDAMESIVNVVTGLISWYSVWLAAKPSDRNHPYGHGKAEFISSAVEGTLIWIAGLVIVYEGAMHLWSPKPLQKLDLGLALIMATGVLNYVAGTYAVRKGKKLKSMALEAGGRHLRTDTFSTMGIVVGLVLMKLTGWAWLDPLMAIGFGIVILVAGYKIMRKSLGGIMDEADLVLLEEMIGYLQTHRPPAWIDLHNLRMIQYGNVLHLDGHMTLPWYFQVKEAHTEIERLDAMIRQRFGDSIELFVHVDGCEPSSCAICRLEACPVRQAAFERTVPWNVDSVLQNKKHSLST